MQRTRMASVSRGRAWREFAQRNSSPWTTVRCRCCSSVNTPVITCRSHVRGILLIYGLHELSDDQRHALYPLDLLLRSYQLPFQAPSRDKNRQYQSSSTFEQGYMPLLILDVFLLQLDVSAEMSIIAAYKLRERSRNRATYSRCLCNLFNVAYSSSPSAPGPSRESMLGMLSMTAGFFNGETTFAGLSTATSPMVTTVINQRNESNLERVIAVRESEPVSLRAERRLMGGRIGLVAREE